MSKCRLMIEKMVLVLTTKGGCIEIVESPRRIGGGVSTFFDMLEGGQAKI